MKTAKTYLAAIEVICPYCEETIEEPNSGSFMWEINEVKANGRDVHCYECGRDSLIPKRHFDKNPR